MPGVILSLGYDIERPRGQSIDSDEGVNSLKRQLNFVSDLRGFLDSKEVPRTFFILGEYLMGVSKHFMSGWFREIYSQTGINEIQQHSYSHPVFRKIKGREDKSIASPQEFIDDLKNANSVLKDTLGIVPTGLRTPLGYPQDLSDMPEILEGLEKLGLDYVSSQLRVDDFSPNPPLTRERQPHTYKDAGYLKIIEIPSHGWHDSSFTSRKWQKHFQKKPDSEEIFQHYDILFNEAEEMAGEAPVFLSLCLHPWAMMEYDPNLEIHNRIISSAIDKEIKFASYGQVAEMARKA